LRTPLNSVIGFANLLMKKQAGRAPDRELDFLRRIVSNGEHLLSLIEDILDLSKIDAQRMQVELEEIDLGEMVLDVVRSMEFQARRKGLYLEAGVDPEGEGPRVEADRRRLRQVLLNLTGNAIKFTSQGGVRVRVAEDDDASGYRIDVEDTGIGIPSEQLDLVFQPFQQGDPSHARAFGGTGLGLTISRSLCHLMGFELRVRSEVGRGSRFSIWMPRERNDDAVPTTDPAAIEATGSLSGAHSATEQENDA
jgi:signal transduction histidine kinase